MQKLTTSSKSHTYFQLQKFKHILWYFQKLKIHFFFNNFLVFINRSMENLHTWRNWPILHFLFIYLFFFGNYRLTNSKKFNKNTKNVISNLKSNFKFSKKSPDLKILRNSLWHQSSSSANVYIVLAEEDSFSSSYFLHKLCIFKIFSLFLH